MADMSDRHTAVHMPVFPGQTPLCHAVGCGCWLAMDEHGNALPEAVTCGNCLRMLRADTRERL
jgi:hypothetical protein